MLIGSEVIPTAITMARYPASRGFSRTMAMLSRNEVPRTRGTGVGVITSSAATSTRYETALIANAGAIPKAAITSAAAAGPIARARLKVIEFSATACVSESRGTSEPTRAICAGFETAVTTPTTPAKPITSHVVASPCQTSTASVTVTHAAIACVQISSRRRSKASAICPVHGERSSTGPNWNAFSTPSRSAECVS